MDPEGALLYYQSSWSSGREELQTVVDGYRETAECNELNHVSENIRGMETALNGQLAVELVQKKEPGYYDLVFMDIQMPIMNGYEAARAIRALGRPDLHKIPIVAMTADAFSDDIQKAKEAGMNDHISKPVDVERLEEVLQKWIAGAG